MKTGFSRLCITPPLGTAITGYYEERFTKGVLDDIYVHAVVFDDGIMQAAVISLDLLQMSSVKCDEYRKAVSEKSGIPFDNLFVTCTHTHTAPLTEKDFDTGKMNDLYYEHFMVTQMCDAVIYALGDLAESSFSVASGVAENISFVRRFRMKNGKVQTNPGVNNPDIDHALGTPNETVKLLKIERKDTDDIFIVNFGTHADTVGGEYISSDFPGFVRSAVESAVSGTKCVFLTGAEGDVNHINPNPDETDMIGLTEDFDGVFRGYEHAKHMGYVIAGAVLKVCQKATPVVTDKICVNNTTIKIPSNSDNDRYEEAEKIVKLHEEGRDSELGYDKMELTTVVAEAIRICTLKDGPDYFDFTLTCLSLGNIAFAGLPGEPFVEIGLEIEKKSPFEEVFVCSLTNGGDSYFPTSAAYDEGGYESRSSLLKKGGDKIIVDGMNLLFESIEMKNEK